MVLITQMRDYCREYQGKTPTVVTIIIAYLLVYALNVRTVMYSVQLWRIQLLFLMPTHTQLDSEEDFPEDHTGHREEEFGEFEAHVPY